MNFEGNGWLILDPLIFLYIWCKFPFLASVWLCSRQHKHVTTIFDFGCETCGCVCVRVWKCGYAILCKWSFPNRKVTTWMPETQHVVSFAPPPSQTLAVAEKLWNSHLGMFFLCLDMVVVHTDSISLYAQYHLCRPSSLKPPPLTGIAPQSREGQWWRLGKQTVIWHPTLWTVHSIGHHITKVIHKRN